VTEKVALGRPAKRGKSQHGTPMQHEPRGVPLAHSFIEEPCRYFCSRFEDVTRNTTARDISVPFSALQNG
jgi:hypothetical protein